MPIYEFICRSCDHRREEIRNVGDTKPRGHCPVCADSFEYIISAPAMHVWNKDRRFPNVVPTGDGSKTFETKAEYEIHLKERNMAEVSTTAPVKTPHGATVKKYGPAQT